MKKQTWKRLLLIAVNVLALGAMTGTLFVRLNANSQAIKNQNVEDFGNIAKSYNNISTSLFTTREETINNLISSVDYFNLDYQGCLTYLNQMQTSDGEFEIVGLDYKGYSTSKNADGTYKPVAYTASSYTNLKSIFDKAGASTLGSTSIPLTPEFSDAITSLRSVVVYAYFTLSDGTTSAPYTLLSVSTVTSNKKAIRIQSQYLSLSFVICDSQGNYLVSDSSFGSDNFFNALYTNNGLTLDKKNALMSTFASQKIGNFEYLNSQGKTCLYSYCQSSDPNLYIIVSVPESEFVGSMTNFWFAFGYVLALAFIFILDFVYVMGLNRTLRENSKAVESANKSKTYFMSQISHDMFTPMNVIIGMSRFIQDSNDMKEIKEYNANVLKSSEYLLSLINDTLDIFRMEAGRYELKKTVSTMASVLSVVSLEIQKLAEKKGITYLEKKTGDFSLPILVDDLKTRYCFFEDKALKEVVLPAGLTTIAESAFMNSGIYILTVDGVTATSNFMLPDGITEIADWAFASSNIQGTVTIPKNVTKIGGYSFYGDDYINGYEVADGNTAFSAEDGILYNADKTSLYKMPSTFYGTYVLPDTVTALADSVFSGNRSITHFVAGKGLKTIGDNAFANSIVTSVSLNEGLTTLGKNAFNNAHGLETIGFPTTLTAIPEWCFYGASLTSVTSWGGVTSIGDYAFGMTTGLTSLDLSSSSIATIGSFAFYSLGNGITSIKASPALTTVAATSFGFDDSLKSLDLSLCTAFKETPTDFLSNVSSDFNSLILPSSLTKMDHDTLPTLSKLTTISYTGSKDQGIRSSPTVF
jgi:hypothetical protein